MDSPFKRPCFIVNVSADRNRAVRHINWLGIEVKKQWLDSEILIVKSGTDLTRLAKEKADHFDLIVACGGDGTVSRVAGGLAGSDAAFGVMPMGSGNDFAKAAGINRSLPECLEILIRGNITAFDMIRYSGDAQGWSANTIGLGLDGLANYQAGQIRNLKGSSVYIIGLLKAIRQFHGSSITLTVDKETSTGTYLMATLCNGPWEGGNFHVAPGADPADGILELLTIRKIPVFLLLMYLPFFLRGPAAWMRGVKSESCTSLEIESARPLTVHVDGEHISSEIRYLSMEIRKSALKVIH